MTGMKTLGTVLATTALAATTMTPAFAQENVGTGTADYGDVNKDTVLCLNNGEDLAVLAIVYESFMDRAPNVRKVTIAPGKTACLRYADAYKIVTDFYFSNEEGKQRLTAFKGICDRVKSGFGKYYVLGYNEYGRKSCTVDKSKSEAEIRAYVANAKSIGL